MIFENKAIQDTLSFAVEAHKGQFRKNNEGNLQLPFIIHPLDVMRQVFNFGINKLDHLYILQAAILHDCIEDTAWGYDAIDEQFGKQVADIVQELSFRDQSEGESSQAFQKAKTDHMHTFQDKSIEALVIKISDRICNCMDFKAVDPQYARKYYNRAEGLWLAFQTRKNEVEQKFGLDVKDLIVIAIGDLRTSLYD
jgi:GTP pyrophosphokinase